MTLMLTNTRELDIDTVILTSYQYAGLVNEMQTAAGPQGDARSAYGRKQLEIIVDQLGAEGIFERTMEWYDLPIAAGSRSTMLPSDTVDIRGDAKYVQSDNSLLTLEPLRREEYSALVIPESPGMPSKFYVSRGVPMSLYLWPVPETDITIRLQRQRLSFDNSSGSATVDLERYWIDYLVNELAARLALGAGLSIERVALYTAKAQAAKTAARGKSTDQLGTRIIMDHRGPYWRGR